MFERFSAAARAAVVRAQSEARGLGHRWIGTEHLLLAAVHESSGSLARTLTELGLSYEEVLHAVRAELGAESPVDDSTALRDLGIDLDAVIQRIEERFGPGALEQPPARRGRRRLLGRKRQDCEALPTGHLPFTKSAKKALELGLREALAAGSKEITLGQLVLGLMRTEGLAPKLVTGLGAPPDRVREAILRRDQAA